MREKARAGEIKEMSLQAHGAQVAQTASLPYRRLSACEVLLVQSSCKFHRILFVATCAALLLCASAIHATPANKKMLAQHFDKFLPANLNACTTCHLPSSKKNPENLDEFPHNPFGTRLRELGKELRAVGKKADIATRLTLVAREDSDGDGVDNLTELLLGHNPGDAQDKPVKSELSRSNARRAEFEKFLASYRWHPFETVQRPPVPQVSGTQSALRNPIDAFLASEQQARGLKPRPTASKEVLLRRVYLDLTGLTPTPEEQAAFLADSSPDAYEKVVDRLLADPRYGERWARHWMDVWRYSDWAGYGTQIRDSTEHIWRWRDWIVESINVDKPYDRMIVEMLAADEIAPEDTDTLRATGFLTRNFKLLSREQWMEDVVGHTSKAFLGLTVGCAKCHNHMYDPISQHEYYQIRAIFEPYNVRIERLPGNANTNELGLSRAYDAATNVPTYFYPRGDERRALTNDVLAPGVLRALGGKFEVVPVSLPRAAAQPDLREFVLKEEAAKLEQALLQAEQRLKKDGLKPEELEVATQSLTAAKLKQGIFIKQLRLEAMDESGRKGTDEFQALAREVVAGQRDLASIESRQALTAAQLALTAAETKSASAAKGTNKTEIAKTTKDAEAAKKKLKDAEEALAKAEKELKEPLTAEFKPRSTNVYPATSTGRRLAFARWVTSLDNPLTARVAMNHIWLRHFGAGLVPSVDDFGANGRAPTHPQLLDWLAAEFMARGWDMKAMHRLIVTCTAYRRASTPDTANAKRDPDNIYLWRMNSRRLEAEAVRDNVLYVAGQLDATMGGKEIDQKLSLTSKRRSLYLRAAAEKESEFMQIFEGASVSECYERKQTVKPQQALALSNSELAITQADVLAGALSKQAASVDEFIRQAYLRVLARPAKPAEVVACREFLLKQTGEPERRRENLILVLFNHNDFITVR